MKSLFLGLLIILLNYSCNKEGVGGKNSISAFPKHHSKSIPGTIIYIKYGTENFPGDDVSQYDDSEIASVEPGNNDAHVHFGNLKKGKYYLYGIGYDSSISEIVKGGIPVNLNSKVDETTVIVPVTED